MQDAELAAFGWPGLRSLSPEQFAEYARYWGFIPAAQREIIGKALDALVKSGQGLRIAVGNLKGGAVKTTTVIHLALALAMTGAKVLVIDADPTNHSVILWKASAGEDWPINVQVLPWATTDLPRRLRAMEGEYTHLLIDTSPSHLDLLQAALDCVTTFLITTQPNPLDVAQLDQSINAAAAVDARKADGLASVIAFTRAKQGTILLRDALSFVDDHRQWPRLETIVFDRVPHAGCFGAFPYDWTDYAWLLADMVAYELGLQCIPGLEEAKAERVRAVEGRAAGEAKAVG